jgi:hypothetical protein
MGAHVPTEKFLKFLHWRRIFLRQKSAGRFKRPLFLCHSGFFATKTKAAAK